jgi:predicted RecB family nuclease
VQTIDGRPVYAATDLVAYLACEHLTQLERAAMAGLVHRPMRDDPELDIIRKRGFEHERRYLADLVAAGRTTVTIELDGSIEDRGDQLRAAAAATIEAMASGADVVYQATFFDGTWRGHADFLLRVDDEARPSVWGPYHYEVADTKLARHVKASAVLQICSYIDQLERIQGVRPEWLHVALGGSARAVERLRVDDYMAYYRSARDRFLATMADETAAAYPPPATYPEPVDHCDVCRWAAECASRRRDDDHLSLVAGISGRQRRALQTRDVATLEALGELALPMDPPLEGASAGALTRVREQARIQLEGRRHGPRYELFLPEPGQPIEPERGLASLPPPSPGDLFFDIEGDPYALEDGLDYLFGVLDIDGEFTAIWSRDADGEFTLDAEREAFEQLMDLCMERLSKYPDMHIYHYAPYEPTALKRLMGRYGTREDDVDRLLRQGVMVDLLRAVRQSLRASVESYSIKKMEPFYGFVREIDLRDAGSSIVAFEQWLELGEGQRPEATHLERIERYNRDDVVSNLRLRDWLEARRVQLAQESGHEVPRPGPREAPLPPDLSAMQARVAELVERLADPVSVPTDPAERSPDQHGRWLLAQLLGWHRREDKAMWWEFHRLMDLTPEQLMDEDEPIGGLVPVEPLDDERKDKQTWRYTFPDQDFGTWRGEAFDPAHKQADPDASPWDWAAGDVVEIDPARSTVDIRRRVDAPHPRAIVPLPWVRTAAHQERLIEIGAWVAEHGIDGDGPHLAARRLLLGRPPAVGRPAGADLQDPHESDLDAARRLVLELDRTTLAIQGPPGSGKTYTGARMILTLLRAGKRVGITGTSHKVIGNLLRAVLTAAAAEHVDVQAVQHGPPDQVVDAPVVRAKDAADVRARLDSGESNLAAGTSWLWASSKLLEAVDVLFVDEAGQISLANVIAMSTATESIVLLGDPQQLDQPVQGSHPPGAERSALAHVLGQDATIPPDRGLFLERTWRLHPALCAFTSEVFYDDRLEPEAHLHVQRLRTPAAGLDGVGPRWVASPSVGGDNESPEEADVVAAIARSLVEGGSTWIDQAGVARPLTWEEVLIVAPYNAQVGAIKRRLPAEARVGTVDKFQGQEAPISLYSMTTSSPELAPRGMDFLYSRNRLNVATSRARCVAVVVAAPDLLRVRARTPEQMRLANAFCRFAELATAESGVAEPPLQADPLVEVLTLGLS